MTFEPLPAGFRGVNRVPIATITSAPSIMSLIVPAAPTHEPMLFGCEYGITPLPPAELTTGNPVISASSFSSSNASARAMPPPAEDNRRLCRQDGACSLFNMIVIRGTTISGCALEEVYLFPFDHSFRRHVDKRWPRST